jgi:hypothetical protein
MVEAEYIEATNQIGLLRKAIVIEAGGGRAWISQLDIWDNLGYFCLTAWEMASYIFRTKVLILARQPDDGNFNPGIPGIPG